MCTEHLACQTLCQAPHLDYVIQHLQHLYEGSLKSPTLPIQKLSQKEVK